MKKIIITAVFGLAAIVMNAQTPGGQRQKPDPQAQTNRMAKDLGLSDDQKAKVLAVNTDTDQKMQALSGEDKDKMREDRKKLGQAKEDKLKTILTADQFKKYLDEREQMKQAHQQKQGQ